MPAALTGQSENGDILAALFFVGNVTGTVPKQ